MLEVIRENFGSEEPCVYLPAQRAKMHYRVVESCAADTYQQMLERGWRRFGQLYFRPVCSGCRECRSLRVVIDAFRPDRSMRRTWRRNRDLEVFLRPAAMTREHLALYERYHADMSARKGWREKDISPLDYYRTFVDGRCDFGHELLYFKADQLVGVALVDLLPRAVSAVYCYYEPSERQRSLGVYSVLRQVELARSRQVPYLYLGYHIAENPSMRYKARYRLHEILRGRPEMDEEPVWEEPEGDEAAPLR